MVGQGAALKHPERVLSLTAISTSPIGVDWFSLPESGEAWLEHMAVDVDWSDRAEAVAYLVKDARLVAGTAYKFDRACGTLISVSPKVPISDRERWPWRWP